MDELKKRVATEFTVEDAATRALGPLSAAFEGIGNLIGNVTSHLNPLNIAMGALAGVLSGAAVMKAGSEFENLQIGLAQTLTFMGQGGKTFQDALGNSAQIMKRIVADSGPLPGNAMDYANALQLSGAVVNRATGDFQKTYDLVKQTTAVSISMKGSAELGAIELNRMLDANRGLMHNMGDFNQKMLNAMRQLPGYAGLTVQEFNKFDLHKRLDVVTRAMGQFKDMVDASSHTWDAVKGAAESTTQLLLKSSTAPLFEAAKKALEGMNNSILAADGNFTPFGQKIVNAGEFISSSLVTGFDRVAEGISRATDKLLGFGGILDSLASTGFFRVIDGLGGRVESAVTQLVKGSSTPEGPRGAVSGQAGGTGMLMAAGAAGGAMLGGAGAGAALLVGGLAEFLSRGNEAVSRFVEGLNTTVGLLGAVIQPVVNLFMAVEGALGDFYQGVLPGLVDGVNSILAPLVDFWSGLSSIATFLFAQLQPTFSYLWGALGNLVESIGSFLGPVLRLLGGVGLWLADALRQVLGPAIYLVGHALGFLANGISALLKWLGSLIGKAADAMGVPAVGSRTTEAPGSSFGKFFDSLRDAIGKVGAAGKPGGALAGGGQMPAGATTAHGGGGRAVQDFRYSRFEITQKFAEGYDPDRVAVAFARDIGKIGESKLQSGHEPVFAVGGV